MPFPKHFEFEFQGLPPRRRRRAVSRGRAALLRGDGPEVHQERGEKSELNLSFTFPRTAFKNNDMFFLGLPPVQPLVRRMPKRADDYPQDCPQFDVILNTFLQFGMLFILRDGDRLYIITYYVLFFWLFFLSFCVFFYTQPGRSRRKQFWTRREHCSESKYFA